MSYTWDAAGRIETQTYPGGAVVTYSYDAAGQVSQVQLADQGQTTVLAGSIHYAPFGPVTE